ncbi:MAG: hypothetical protein ACKOYK_13115 [Cyanobium sp.]
MASTHHRWLLLIGLSLCLGISPGAWGKEANKTICCRASGGTRGTCLNVWAHLVPTSNRFHPGPSRTIAILQGASPTPTAMTVQLSTLEGELVGEQTLPEEGASVRLLTLPEANRPPLNQPLMWESFPTCRPNKPPTRTILVGSREAGQEASERQLAELRKSCGKVVDIAPLLKAFAMEEFSAKLPPSLPVRCDILTAASLGIR